MNKIVLFAGAAIMWLLGMFSGADFNAQTSVGLGLMWLGFSLEGK